MNKKIILINNPAIEMVQGFHSNGIASGIKKNGNHDLGVVFFDKECDGFGMFTTNKVKAAPVLVSKKHIKNKIRALFVNSGNANACTGESGFNDAINICKEIGESFNIPYTSVIPMSTGVIGQRLPTTVIKNGIIKISKIINEPNDNQFVKAIMTTDTKMKIYCVKVKTENYEYSVIGCAKGSGMIHPNMATMLGFIFSDAVISKSMANKAFRSSIDKSFNSITVDGDTSTNDSVFLFNSNCANNKPITSSNADYKLYEEAVQMVASQLARKIVEDGEGATKLVEVEVKGAKNIKQAKQAAFSVATSSLVKTAFYGEDANWGRIVCAIGYSGIPCKPENIKLYFDNLLLFKNGEPTTFNEADASKILKKTEFKVTVDLGIGNKSWTVWTTDLTNEYIRINANYRS